MAIGQITAQICVDCENTTNSGTNSSAIGTNTKSTGNSTFASGFGAEATYNFTTSLGFYSFATNAKAVAIGSAIKANSEKSVVIGAGDWNANIYLENNHPRSLMIGFRSKFPTLFVSESTMSPWYDKTGKVGIGNVTSPQAKLHIKADEGEAASVLVEPYIWGLASQANLWLGNTTHGLEANSRNGLVFHTQSSYVFNEGNVGIRTGETAPETELEVVGTIKTTGFRLQNEGARDGYVLMCSNINGQARWQDPATYSVWSLNNFNQAYRMSKVGIGIEDPKEMLDVNGNILVLDAITGKISDEVRWNDPDFLNLKGSDLVNSAKIAIPKGNNLEQSALKIINPMEGAEVQFHVNSVINFTIRKNDVVIGRPDHEMELKLNGKMWAHEVEIQLTEWWDDVFKPEYNLMSLDELEDFITTNQHLPEIPSETEVLEDGIKIGEMNALLLKKVEELTLYVIELKKELDEVKQNAQTN